MTGAPYLVKLKLRSSGCRATSLRYPDRCSNFHWAGIRILKFLIALIILLLLFSNRLPSIARSLGQSIVEFKRGVKEIDNQSDDDKSEHRP